MTSFNVGDAVVFVKVVDGMPIGTEAEIVSMHPLDNTFILTHINTPNAQYYDAFDDEWIDIEHNTWWVKPSDIEHLVSTSNIVEPSEDIYNDLI